MRHLVVVKATITMIKSGMYLVWITRGFISILVQNVLYTGNYY